MWNNKKSLLLLPLALLVLSSCNTENASSSVSKNESTSSSQPGEEAFVPMMLTPSGAPTLALYDMGSEENWDSTSATTTIPAAFHQNGYDAIIFDGVNGLNNLVKNENENFALARFLTGGNFHLVSLTKESFDASSPITIFSFGEGNLPDLVFKYLLEEAWNVDLSKLTITYGSEGVQNVGAALQSQSDYDYFFIAEPVLTASKNALANKATIHEIYDLRAEWEKETGQVAIPQAALFLRKSAYNSQKSDFDSFLEHIDENINNALNNPMEVKKAMDEYSTDSETQQGRWGFSSSLAYNLQKDHKNRFGLIDPEDLSDNQKFVNDFGKILYGEDFVEYKEELFL